MRDTLAFECQRNGLLGYTRQYTLLLIKCFLVGANQATLLRHRKIAQDALSISRQVQLEVLPNIISRKILWRRRKRIKLLAIINEGVLAHRILERENHGVLLEVLLIRSIHLIDVILVYVLGCGSRHPLVLLTHCLSCVVLCSNTRLAELIKCLLFIIITLK